MPSPEELAQKLISWIREQVTTANRHGVAVGLSGGIDSAVVVVLCKKAFPDNTLGVVLPCHSSSLDTDHALLVARKFDIPTVTVTLDKAFDTLLTVLPQQGLEPAARRLAEANLKPRLRMLTLYYLANSRNYMVVGTGNRSEITVGYFTKYGDGGVDIQPLGNLVKRDARSIAEFLGIPDEIIQKPPSAGLWEGQTDEQEMGISYEELDSYILTGQARPEVRQRVDALAQASAHKKRTPPIPTW